MSGYKQIRSINITNVARIAGTREYNGTVMFELVPIKGQKNILHSPTDFLNKHQSWITAFLNNPEKQQEDKTLLMELIKKFSEKQDNETKGILEEIDIVKPTLEENDISKITLEDTKKTRKRKPEDITLLPTELEPQLLEPIPLVTNNDSLIQSLYKKISDIETEKNVMYRKMTSEIESKNSQLQSAMQMLQTKSSLFTRTNAELANVKMELNTVKRENVFVKNENIATKKRNVSLTNDLKVNSGLQSHCTALEDKIKVIETTLLKYKELCNRTTSTAVKGLENLNSMTRDMIASFAPVEQSYYSGILDGSNNTQPSETLFPTFDMENFHNQTTDNQGLNFTSSYDV